MNAKVYASVMERAGGVCECGCLRGFDEGPFSRATLDHMFGRHKAPEDEAHCWALREDHHADKTASRPDAATWLLKFAQHADRYGYVTSAARARARLFAVEVRAGFRRAVANG
jgi:hypothetical protein